MKSRKRILVTGGAGFLGSHLIDRFIDSGHEVICLDNLLTGTRNNIQHHLDHSPAFRFIRHDVCVPIDIEVDEIYNLACPASPVHYQSNPVLTTKTCLLGALNTLELARRLGATIFQASTSEVYGCPTMHPQPEWYWGTVNPIGPRSCYNEGKRCAETLFFDYFRQHKTSIKVARIFNTYGPRLLPNDGRVVSNFIVKALSNDDITLSGDGSQTRSFCYVDDLIDGILRFGRTPVKQTGPINLGNPTEITIFELAQTVVEIIGSRSKIVYGPERTDDPIQRQPDISEAKRLLGWAPKVDLIVGLRTTVAYFDDLLKRSRHAAEREAEIFEAPA